MDFVSTYLADIFVNFICVIWGAVSGIICYKAVLYYKANVSPYKKPQHLMNVEIYRYSQSDAPNFPHATVSYAQNRRGEILTQKELDKINENRSLVRKLVMIKLQEY